YSPSPHFKVIMSPPGRIGETVHKSAAVRDSAERWSESSNDSRPGSCSISAAPGAVICAAIRNCFAGSVWDAKGITRYEFAGNVFHRRFTSGEEMDRAL